MAAFIDTELYQTALHLSLKYDIKKIVETGTNDGLNAILLATIVPNVLTMELIEETYNTAITNIKNGVVFSGGKQVNLQSFKNSKIDCRLGSSPIVMDECIKDDESDILFFLDAHWYDYLPLLDELEVIRKKRLKNVVIIIHDFVVPDENGNPKFGTMNIPNSNRLLDFDYVKAKIDEIYGVDNYSYFYSTKTELNAGVIYIEPMRKQ